MVKPTDPRSREERLAAKLRENLHRRKAQARAQHVPGDPDRENDSRGLSNPAPDS